MAGALLLVANFHAVLWDGLAAEPGAAGPLARYEWRRPPLSRPTTRKQPGGMRSADSRRPPAPRGPGTWATDGLKRQGLPLLRLLLPDRARATGPLVREQVTFAPAGHLPAGAESSHDD